MRYNQRMRVRVIQPPVSIARDFIDYPYFADLGAAQLAAVLMQTHQVQLVDAYALPGSSLTWRADGRAHLGAPVKEVVDGCGDADLTVVAYTPFHRPPARDDVLAELLQALKGAIWLADCYQSGQHYIESDGVLAAYPEAEAWIKYEAEATLPELLATGARGVIAGREVEDLDGLPPPAWQLV